MFVFRSSWRTAELPSPAESKARTPEAPECFCWHGAGAQSKSVRRLHCCSFAFLLFFYMQRIASLSCYQLGMNIWRGAIRRAGKQTNKPTKHNSSRIYYIPAAMLRLTRGRGSSAAIGCTCGDAAQVAAISPESHQAVRSSAESPPSVGQLSVF